MNSPSRLRVLFDLLRELPIAERAHVLSLALPDGLDRKLRENGMIASLLGEAEGDALSTPLQEPRPVADGLEFLRVLGEGATGVVWLARRTIDSTRLAVKVFKSSDRLRLRLARELSVSQRLEHSNIAKFEESGETADGRPFIASELVGGPEGVALPLDRFAILRDLSPRAVVSLMRTVCSAISYCHSHGLIHRDLKPANILVGLDGVPLLVDFGLMKASGEIAAGGLTRTGEAVGTVGFAAPEQFHGVATPAADIYSIGATLRTLLKGSPSDGRRLPLVATGMRAVIVKCLEPNPARRYRSVAALDADLARWLSGRHVHASIKGRAKLAVVTAFVVCVLAASSYVYHLRTSGHSLAAKISAEIDSIYMQVAKSQDGDPNERMSPRAVLVAIENAERLQLIRASIRRPFQSEQRTDAWIAYRTGRAHVDIGDAAPAAVAYDEAVRRLRSLIAAIPEDPGLVFDLACALREYSRMATILGQHDCALKAASEASHRFAAYIALRPDDHEAKANLAELLEHRANLQGDSTAQEDLKRAVELAREICAARPGYAPHLRNLRSRLLRLAQAVRSEQKADDALTILDECIDLNHRLGTFDAMAVQASLSRAAVLASTGHLREAERDLHALIVRCDSIPRLAPEAGSMQLGIARASRLLGDILGSLGEYASAHSAYQKSVSNYSQLVVSKFQPFYTTSELGVLLAACPDRTVRDAQTATRLLTEFASMPRGSQTAELALALATIGRMNEAVEITVSHQAKAGNDPGTLLLFGQVFAMADDLTEASRILANVKVMLQTTHKKNRLYNIALRDLEEAIASFKRSEGSGS